MADAVSHTPEGYMQCESIGVETVKKEIDDAEGETGDDETLKLLPGESGKPLAFGQFDTLKGEHIAAHKGDGFDTEAADKVSEPPIKAVFWDAFGRCPTSGEDA